MNEGKHISPGDVNINCRDSQVKVNLYKKFFIYPSKKSINFLLDH